MYELYSIENENGAKVMHIFRCVWKNDGRAIDDDLQPGEPDHPYTVTDYTWCLIPVVDLIGKTKQERWDMICDAEAAVNQYEEDLTQAQFDAEGLNDPGCEYLPYEKVDEHTPVGDYYYTY